MSLKSQGRGVSMRQLMLVMTLGIVLITTGATIFFVRYQSIKTILAGEDRQAHSLLKAVALNVETEYQSVLYLREHAIAQRKAECRETGQVALRLAGICYQDYRSGRLSLSAAQRGAIAHLDQLGHAAGFVWVISADEAPEVLLYPAGPALEKNRAGPAVVRAELRRMAASLGRQPEAFLELAPGPTAPKPRIVYLHRFDAWNWIIGTTAYTDDIEIGVERRKAAIIEELQDSLAQVKLGQSGYIHIFDGQLNMLIHPKLQGNSENKRRALTASKGLMQAQMRAARQPGLVHEYIWDKPGHEGEYRFRKRTYATYFAPLDWYIVAAVYVDEFAAPAVRLSRSMVQLAVLFCGLAVVLALVAARLLSRPLLRLSRAAGNIEKHGLGASEIPVGGPREIRNLGLILGRMAAAIMQSNKALRASETQFRTIFEHAPNGIMISRLEDGLLLDANLAFLEMCGLENKPAAQGLSFWDFARPESRAVVAGVLNELRKGHLVKNVELRIQLLDGSLRDVIFSSILLDSVPERAVLSMVVDVTDKVRTEVALRASESKLRSLFAAMHDVIIVLNAEGRYVEIAPTSSELLYVSPTDLLGKTMAEVLPGAQTDLFLGCVREVLAKGESVTLDYSMEIGGQLVWFAAKVSPFTHDSVLWVARNITERKLSEQALIESERRLSEAQRMAHFGHWSWDIASGRVEWSPEVFRIFQLDPASFTPQIESIMELSPWPEDHARDQELVRRAMESHENGSYEQCFVRPDGSTGHYVSSFQGRYDAAGQLVAIIGTVQDITERKLAEQEHAKLQEQLIQSQKMESIGRLAGGVAHDFNNMLAVILGHVDMAQAKLATGQDPTLDLKAIKKAGDRSVSLTRQLLAFARKQVAQPQVLALNEVVENMSEMLRRLIGEDVTLSWRPGRDLWLVKVDPAHVDQILMNLCVNARDAISAEGNIMVETANVAIDEAYCAAHLDSLAGEYVRLVVSDNGCGMDKSTQARLFEPFFTTKAAGKGTGLGLATVYGIVKQNNGFINFYSEVGLGSTFKIYLPRFEGCLSAPVARQDRVAAGPGGDETILLVEDEVAILEMTAQHLSGLGYRVLTAGSPDQALALAGQPELAIDLLLTDVIMPEMNGRELAQQLTALRPQVAVLFMSGYTADAIAHNGVMIEGVHFLQKPFSVNELAAKVRAALAG